MQVVKHFARFARNIILVRNLLPEAKSWYWVPVYLPVLQVTM